MAYHETLPVRLLNHDVDPRRLLPHLPKIAMLTDLPLLAEPLRVPKNDWETILERAPSQLQRRVLREVKI